LGGGARGGGKDFYWRGVKPTATVSYIRNGGREPRGGTLQVKGEESFWNVNIFVGGKEDKSLGSTSEGLLFFLEVKKLKE